MQRPAAPMARISRLHRQLRRDAGALLVDNFFRAISLVGRLHPEARPRRHGIELVKNVPYRETGLREHRLDIYRPSRAPGPWPIVLYVHGGGFRILSKDTHWVMGLTFASRGYLVFNISYRLAPRHPFPGAFEDACAAYRWVVENAPRHGGDPSRLVLAGESAGANLITALTVASCYPRPEPFARAVFETGVVPRAVLPACGILQVTDTERIMRRKKIASWVADRLTEVTDAYLSRAKVEPSTLDLADPLLVLERGEEPARPLPPFFAPVGTRDPLLDDTRRLKAALDRMGVRCEARYYVGEPHAFHAILFREAARRCWSEAFTFLAEHLSPAPAEPVVESDAPAHIG